VKDLCKVVDLMRKFSSKINKDTKRKEGVFEKWEL
jgi:hypothetical protein